MKLISWNIQWGLGIDGACDPGRIIAHARSMADFDILCLQEVADNLPELHNGPKSSQFAEIAALLPGYTAIEGVALDMLGPDGRRQRFGNMMFSRWPVHQILRITLPWAGVATRNMPRGLIEATVAAPFGPLRVMTTHLEYSHPDLRSGQVEAIRDLHAQACARFATQREDGPGTYRRLPATRSALLTGDFNMRPDDPLKQRMAAPFPAAPALLDAWTLLHGQAPHPPSSCLHDSSGANPFCCDYAFISEDLAPRLRKITYDQNTKASDHQPLLVEIEDGPSP